MTRQLLETVAYCAEQGVAHRDLKSQVSVASGHRAGIEVLCGVVRHAMPAHRINRRVNRSLYHYPCLFVCLCMQNILVDKDYKLRVADFGLAKLTSSLSHTWLKSVSGGRRDAPAGERMPSLHSLLRTPPTAGYEDADIVARMTSFAWWCFAFPAMSCST